MAILQRWKTQDKRRFQGRMKKAASLRKAAFAIVMQEA